MKVIISQDGLQMFYCTASALFNVAAIEIPPNDGGEAEILYSVGVGGISFGQFASQETAKAVLRKITNFMVSEHERQLDIPADSATDETPTTESGGAALDGK